jgi:transcription termination factor NusB
MKNKISANSKMKPPDDPLPYYKGVKNALKSIIKRPATQQAILDAVGMSHKIFIHVTFFLKMYMIHLFDQNLPLPKVDRTLCVNIMKVICEESQKVEGQEEVKKQGRKPNGNTVAMKDGLCAFFKAHYEPNWENKEGLTYKNLNTMMDYGFDKLVTSYENNIKQHFVEHVERFVNVMMDKKETMEQLQTEAQKRQFTNRLRKIKNTILDLKNEEIPNALLSHLPFIMPQRPMEKDSVYYDLCVHPQDYLRCMIYIGKQVEAKGKSLLKVFPIRNDIVPKYVRIDTTTLVHLCINKDNRKHFGSKDELLHHGNLVREKDNIWTNFFRTELRCFNYPRKERKPQDVPRMPRRSVREKKYQFDHQIETDGEAVTILLIRKDMAGKFFKPKQKPKKEEYIDEVDPTLLQGKDVVGVDPNKQDLIHCSMLDENGERVGFRYTQDQRRKETKSKKYSKAQDQLKKDTVVEGKTIKEWEAELSQYNNKTLNLEAFKAYVKAKNKMNQKLMAFYSQRLFRQLKWYAFINRKRTERLMLQRFLNTFGSPENVVIAFGDWEQKKHMKYKEPTKGKGWRKLFREFGYLVYLVDEFRTSCKCYNCKSTEPQTGSCEKFRMCENPRPWKAGEHTLRHGLVKCKTCQCLWNRDVLSSLNMEAIGTCAKLGLPRPDYLYRGG